MRHSSPATRRSRGRHVTGCASKRLRDCSTRKACRLARDDSEQFSICRSLVREQVIQVAEERAGTFVQPLVSDSPTSSWRSAAGQL